MCPYQIKNLLIVTFLLTLNVVFSQGVISNIQPQTSTLVPKYSKFEVGIELTSSTVINNPYDTDEIRIEAMFTSPTGAVFNVFGFYMIPFERIDTTPFWNQLTTQYPYRVRFSPNELGDWSYTINIIINGVNEGSSISQIMTCEPSKNPGFVNLASNNRYLEFSNGQSFFGIAEDLRAFTNTGPAIPSDCPSVVNGWTSTAECSNYCYSPNTLNKHIEWVTSFKENGGNYVRIWLEPYSYEIEWENIGDYSGRQNRAGDLDILLDLAFDMGVYVHLVLLNEQHFSIRDCSEQIGCWEDNPYNMNLPLANNSEFFNNLDAIEIYKKRLNYIHARWGYSPAIISYGIINEPEFIGKDSYTDTFLSHSYWTNTTTEAFINDWFIDIGNHLKNISYPVHLNSIDFATNTESAANYDTAIDFTNTHLYSWDRNTEYQRNYTSQHNISVYNKPFTVTEFALTASDCWISESTNTDVHNTIWSSVFSGSFSTLMYFGGFSKYHNTCYGGDGVKVFLPLSDFLKHEKFNDIDNPYYSIGNALSYYNSYPNPSNEIQIDAPVFEEKGIAPPDWFMATPFSTNHLVDGMSTTNDRNIHVFALKNNEKIIGWIGNKNHYWHNLEHYNASSCSNSADLENSNITPTNLYDFSPITNEVLTIDNLSCDGTYKIEWFNTYYYYDFDNDGNPNEGGVIESLTSLVNSSNGVLTIDIPKLQAIQENEPPFAPDYGFKITLMDSDYVSNVSWNHSFLGGINIPTENICGDIEINESSTEIYYRGCDNRIHAYSYNSSNDTWTHSLLSTTLDPSENICGNIVLHENTGSIYYAGCDSEVHRYIFNGTVWEHFYLTSLGSTSDNICGDITINQNSGSIYYVGCNDYIHQFWFNSGTNNYNHAYLTSTFSTSEHGCGEIEVSPITGSIYYRGCDSNMHQYWYNGTWNHAYLLPSTSENVCGEIEIDMSGTIYYHGCDNEIHQYWYDNGWNSSVFSSISDNEDNICGDLGINSSNGFLYYQGCDDNINQYWYDGLNWRHTVITQTFDDTDDICGDIEINGNLTIAFYQGCDNVLQMYEWSDECQESAFCLNFDDPMMFNSSSSISSDFYHFQGGITTQGTVVETSDDVIITAEDCILMPAGFEVELGATYHAYIDTICKEL